MNLLVFGHNLGWLRDTKEFPDASQAQFYVFTDTWTWADAAETYNQFISCFARKLAQEYHS
jgi:hypothetical protein